MCLKYKVGNRVIYLDGIYVIVGTRKFPINSPENIKILGSQVCSPFHPSIVHDSSEAINKGAIINFKNEHMDYQISKENKGGECSGIIECLERDITLIVTTK